MKHTKIQWCHSTVNPVMGCDGCELWKPASAIRTVLLKLLLGQTSWPERTLRQQLADVLGDRTTSDIYRDRERVAAEVVHRLGGNAEMGLMLIDTIRRECKCYAGLLGTFRAGHSGYADTFESPKLYPGRVEKAADWRAPALDEVDGKRWLRNLPRLIFISDMGDALSGDVPFDYLRQEIISNVRSEAGCGHLWLWLSKRPQRMADFGAWLLKQDEDWPENLVSMTTVTEQKFARRVDDLRRVPSTSKGLSLEPLFEPVDLNLTGIDWVIVGGGSDVLAKPFHVEWALQIREQCRAAGVAFFLKQLGKHSSYEGRALQLENTHGGDWGEWPKEWRVREFPEAFYQHVGRNV